MKKAAILAGSHLLCLVAGGLLIRATGEAAAGSAAAAGPAKSGERGSPVPLAVTGKELAGQAIADSKAAPFEAAEIAAKADRLKIPGEGEKLVRALTADGTLAPPVSAEFAGALLAWFREDAQAALRFIEEAGMGSVYDAVLQQALAELTPAEHLQLAKGLAANSKASLRLGEILGKRLAELDPAEAADLWKKVLQGSVQLLRPIVAGWPADDAEGFLEMALAVGDINVIQNYLFGSANPRKASALLLLMESRGDLPPEFADFLANAGELRGHLYRYADPSVPLDERIAQMANLAWLKDATPEKLREGALKQISTVDINELMKNGPDYRYAFRHGAMTADEILQAVRTTFPELAAASDYETRVRVFNELASEDAQAAYALIAHLPEEQRNLAVIHQSRWTFRDTSPDAFLNMINLAPGPDSAEAAPQRADAWSSYGQSAYREYGDYYLDWVREMPSGVNRDVARSTLASVLRKQNRTGLAAEFEKP